MEQEIGSQIALLTIESLHGARIEDYSLAVANAWGLGRRGIDDGVLITIAPKDRTVRIEVGYGLELVISDQAAADVIRRMVPELAAGDSFTGIRKGSRTIAGAPARRRSPSTGSPAARSRGGPAASPQYPALYGFTGWLPGAGALLRVTLLSREGACPSRAPIQSVAPASGRQRGMDPARRQCAADALGRLNRLRGDRASSAQRASQRAFATLGRSPAMHCALRRLGVPAGGISRQLCPVNEAQKRRDGPAVL